MDDNWSDAVKRLIGNELLPCPICGKNPDISYEGNFFSHDLYSVGCYHYQIEGYNNSPPLITPLSTEFSDCIRMWNELATKSWMDNITTIQDIIQNAITAIAESQEENLHDSFTKFLRSD